MSLLLAALLVTKLPVLVRTYDAVGLSGAELHRARQRAEAALHAIDIDPIWRPCRAAVCVSQPLPNEIEIRIVRSTAWSERDSLGFSTIDVARHAGTLGTVYADRVGALAAAASVERGALIGQVIAHEIGHLLLGTTDHARSGLMRAAWRVPELRRNSPLDWGFSRREGGEMRRRLVARIDGQVAPDSVVASGAPVLESARLSVEDNLEETWKSVRRLEPGAKIVITVDSADGAPAERYFVRLDGEYLVVLNLGAPDLPKRRLLAMAADHPDWMSATWKAVYKDNSLRVGPDGVFVKGRKVADLVQVVERIPRARVVAVARK